LQRHSEATPLTTRFTEIRQHRRRRRADDQAIGADPSAAKSVAGGSVICLLESGRE